MCTFIGCRGVLALAMVLSLAGVARAVTAGQIDDFEDGSLLNWNTGPNGEAPFNVTTGGPAGTNDNFLSLVSNGGTGANSKWVTINATQWAGNYANISAIEMDLKRISGSTPMSMRIALKQFTGQSAGFVTTTPVVLNDSNWTHAVFSINSSSLTSVNGATNLSTFLTSIGEIRILHSAAPAVIGDSVVGTVGVDNIKAVAAPEPGGLSLLALAGVGFVKRRRRPTSGD